MHVMELLISFHTFRQWCLCVRTQLEWVKNTLIIHKSLTQIPGAGMRSTLSLYFHLDLDHEAVGVSNEYTMDCICVHSHNINRGWTRRGINSSGKWKSEECFYRRLKREKHEETEEGCGTSWNSPISHWMPWIERCMIHLHCWDACFFLQHCSTHWHIALPR